MGEWFWLTVTLQLNEDEAKLVINCMQIVKLFLNDQGESDIDDEFEELYNKLMKECPE